MTETPLPAVALADRPQVFTLGVLVPLHFLVGVTQQPPVKTLGGLVTTPVVAVLTMEALAGALAAMAVAVMALSRGRKTTLPNQPPGLLTLAVVAVPD
jgi:hypothetical protein